MYKKVAVTIAGSDPSGGAGIQADLKSFSFLGVHGATIVTCVTAQNTQQVKSIHKVPAEIVRDQIDVVFDDFNVQTVKTGMLFDEKIIKGVAEKLNAFDIKLVVDPVMVATSGDALSESTFVHALKTHLLPQTDILTANVPEAEQLSGMSIYSVEEGKKACRALFDLGPNYVLIKGGHLKGKDAIDLFFDGKQHTFFPLPRIPGKKAHGSGCSLSAMITGYLLLGEQPIDAVRKAKTAVWSMIAEGYQVGKGADVLNHSCRFVYPSHILKGENFEVWHSLKKAVESLVSFLPVSYTHLTLPTN